MLIKNIKAITVGMIIICVIFVSWKKQHIYSEECFGDYPLNNYVIVVDAGHGGEDGGAIGIKTLVREKDINLSIAKKLGRLLESSGATVILTRKNEDALCKGSFNKMEDMKNRAKVIENANPYLVISIHCNSFPHSINVKGAQVFYYPDSIEGKKFAESVQSSLSINVDDTNDRIVKSEDFFMLRHGNSANIMVECGFLSSPEEEVLLMDDNYQNKLAYAIFDGTSKYLFNTRTPDNI